MSGTDFFLMVESVNCGEITDRDMHDALAGPHGLEYFAAQVQAAIVLAHKTRQSY